MSALENAATTIETKGKALLEGADPLPTAQILIEAVHQAQKAQVSGSEAFAIGSSPTLMGVNRLSLLNGYLEKDAAGAHGESPGIHVNYRVKGFGQEPTSLEITRGGNEKGANWLSASIDLTTGSVFFHCDGKPK